MPERITISSTAEFIHLPQFEPPEFRLVNQAIVNQTDGLQPFLPPYYFAARMGINQQIDNAVREGKIGKVMASYHQRTMLETYFFRQAQDHHLLLTDHIFEKKLNTADRLLTCIYLLHHIDEVGLKKQVIQSDFDPASLAHDLTALVAICDQPDRFDGTHARILECWPIFQPITTLAEKNNSSQ